MKTKLFTLLFAVVANMGVAVAATAPTAADLLNDGYDPTANVVLCINPIEDATVCNDIYFVGSFSDWASSFTACPKFKALTGFEGWYVAEVEYAEGFQGKPVQAQSDGSFSWNYQAGDQNAWVHVAGLEATIEAGYGDEANVYFGSAGAYIYQLKYWKKHKTPCVAVVKHQYTIKLYAPDACADMKPAISGDDMGWGIPPIAMTEDMDDEFNTIYTYSFVGQEGHAFKIREVNDDSNWSNQMQYYDEDYDAWWTFDNIELTADSNIVLNWGDNEKYRFAKCTGSTETANIVVLLSDVANYIDFQALSVSDPSMTLHTVTSTNPYTLSNGSKLVGFEKSDGTETENKWNVKEGYNTTMPTPSWNGVDSLKAGTMFRAASGTTIELGGFQTAEAGKLVVYFQPNGDSERGVSVAISGGDPVEVAKSGVKIDGIRPAYAAEFDLPAGTYDAGDVVIKLISNTSNIFGVRIDKLGAQGIEDVKSAVKAEKRFENGQLVIIKNGVKFNALGAQL